MNVKRIVLIGVMSLAGATAVASTASADTPWQKHHPRQEEVFGRLDRQRYDIRHEYREGDMSWAKEHRLLARDHRIGREDRHFARASGGYITKGEQRFMNHQENGTYRQMPG